MIRSHNVEFQSCFCPGNDAAGDSRTLSAHRGRQTVFQKCPRSVQASKALIRHKSRKFLMSKWLPRMDSNHDKVIQSHLCYRYTTRQKGRGIRYFRTGQSQWFPSKRKADATDARQRIAPNTDHRSLISGDQLPNGVVILVPAGGLNW